LIKIIFFVGSDFCPSVEDSLAIVEIYYSDLSYRVITEEEAYPVREMINEWSGILGLYFGFSFFSIVAMIKGAIVTYRKKAQIKKRIVEKVIDTWKNPNIKPKPKPDLENGHIKAKYDCYTTYKCY
jgi:hypothetical protein